MAVNERSRLQFLLDFTVIDLETTGRSNSFTEVTELSAIRYRGGVAVDSFTSLIKARNTITPFVVGLTGITDGMLLDAPRIEETINDFVAFIGDDVILGHNVFFDYGLVNGAYYNQHGVFLNNDCIDTLRISRLLNKDIQNHKLGTLCEYFDVRRDIAHRGLEDSRQTAEVYLKMRDKYLKLREAKRQQEGFYERIRLG